MHIIYVTTLYKCNYLAEKYHWGAFLLSVCRVRSTAQSQSDTKVVQSSTKTMDVKKIESKPN